MYNTLHQLDLSSRWFPLVNLFFFSHTQSAEELKATNDMVEKDIEKLRAEKDELIDMLSSHQCAMRTSRKPSSP